jgi:Sec-independent protein translocase protein TatA
MAKYTKKWDKDFTKRYSDTLKQLESLEKEYQEMVETNPDKWIPIYPSTSQVDLGIEDGFFIWNFGDDETPHIDIQLSSKLGGFSFSFYDLKKLIEFRNDLMKAIDEFKRPLEDVKQTIDSDCEEDLDDVEETEWEIKAEQPLTQSWTYRVMARSACEAIKKIEEGDEDVENNDDNEYYDYGDIEYEAI